MDSALFLSPKGKFPDFPPDFPYIVGGHFVDYLLEARNLGIRYQGERFLFRHVNFAFPKTGLFAILGASGSGKSTLMHLLAGLETPTEGKVCFFGKDIAKFSSKQRRHFHGKMVAFLFQHYELLSGHSVLENVALPLLLTGVSVRKAKRRAKELLARFGLETKSKEDVVVLSGGEKQRVALARALIADPKILFADEPTGALDSLSASFVMETLKQESKDRLVFLVSHNLPLVKQYADFVISLTGEEAIMPALGACAHLVPSPKQRIKRSKGWKASFLLSHFQEDGWKNILGFVSGYVGFSMLLLSLGFAYGSTPALEESASASLGYGYLELTKKERMGISGSELTLVKETIPTMEESEALFQGIGVSIERDYSFFFPLKNPFSRGNERFPASSFSPLGQVDPSRLASLITEGSYWDSPSFRYLYVNESMASEYGIKVHDLIQVPFEFTFAYRGVSEEVSSSLEFEVLGICRDFAFMGSPTFYYSYDGLVETLRNFPLPKLQERFGASVNLPYLLDLQEKEGSFLSSSRWVFALPGEENALREFQRNAREESSAFELSSPSFEAEYSFLMLADALNSALALFGVIAAFSLSALLGMSGYSCFYSHKKEGAILRILGAKEGDVSSLFVEETMFVSFFSMLASLLSAPSLSRLVNSYFFSEFGIASLIRVPLSSLLGIPFLLPLAGLGVALGIGFFSSWIPLTFHKNASLGNEVRDE